ncbi:MAG: SDR family oxidoreductase [Phycisphaeraceae bacterium]|nr:SDR family oxidoreductase [Phycisphaeraceae bacterium]
MISELKDKVAIITGASEGIGRAVCLALAEHGTKIVLSARNKERLLALQKEIESKGSQALVVPTDVTDEAACRNLIKQTVAEYGQLDVLVNNAGQTMWTTMEEMVDTSIYERLMRLNFFGSLYCTYYAVPHLKKTQGRIIMVSSLAGIMGIPARTAYCASKHAMVGFAESLRIELRKSGVSVTIVAPDFVLSEMHRRALDKEGNPLNESPLQESKIMTSEECAALIMEAIIKRKRLQLTSFRGKLGRFLKLFAPNLMDKMAAKAIEEKEHYWGRT